MSAYGSDSTNDYAYHMMFFQVHANVDLADLCYPNTIVLKETKGCSVCRTMWELRRRMICGEELTKDQLGVVKLWMQYRAPVLVTENIAYCTMQIDILTMLMKRSFASEDNTNYLLKILQGTRPLLTWKKTFYLQEPDDHCDKLEVQQEEMEEFEKHPKNARYEHAHRSTQSSDPSHVTGTLMPFYLRRTVYNALRQDYDAWLTFTNGIRRSHLPRLNNDVLSIIRNRVIIF